MAEAAGVRVPKAMVLTQGDDRKLAVDFALKTGYPVYVKPVKAGSSYGVTKVEKPVELQSAIIKAFQYDDEVIIEENIDGFEVGCAVLGNRNLITGEVDEIQLSGGFFDFTEKYTLKISEIHVPALMFLNENADFFLTRIFARMAVPLFLIITGRYVAAKFWETDSDGKNYSVAVLLRYKKRYFSGADFSDDRCLVCKSGTGKHSAK